MERRECRFCGTKLEHTVVDLGLSPLTNAYIREEELSKGEIFLPLHAMVCSKCFLVQVLDYEEPENIFSEYDYFSSYSSSWLEHAKSYVDEIVSELDLNEQSQVIEIASNDGYLLQYFKEHRVKALGIEPAGNVAMEAEKKGITTIIDFFGTKLATQLKDEGIQADLLIGNNVLAHVPNINDFVGGAKKILKEYGVITMEFPHLLNLIKYNQFDTIYHEHFSYLSLMSISKVFESKGLKIYDIKELPTHGGSLRIYATHQDNHKRQVSENVERIIQNEVALGLDQIETYTEYHSKIQRIKRNILQLFTQLKNQDKKIVAYGAAAKGNTLLNYCGIGKDFIDYVVDANPHKQGKYLPGTRIPITNIDEIAKSKPDYIIIFPWNIKKEIIELLSFTREWGAKAVVLIPEIEIIDL